MNRSPTPGGVFCGVSWVGVECLRSVCHVIGNPLAAVGSDLSRPHIRERPRNGDEYAYLIMWKCVFGNANMCNW